MKTRRSITASHASLLATVSTTDTRIGGWATNVGLGKLFDGRIFKSGANGFYYEDDEGHEWRMDGGRAYYDRVRKLFGNPW
jgi:hypothetical protein